MSLAGILGTGEPVIRVQIAQAHGSTPREAGAVMIVSERALHGTIGGGQLEYLAIAAAREVLALGQETQILDIPLGPEIGQCCGGRVRLRLEPLDAQARAAMLRAQEARSVPHVLIFGAGHVGRALARALALLPLHPILIDSREGELAMAPDSVEARLTPLPEADLRAAPAGSAFIVMTHDHALDFMLVAEALTRRDAGYIGLIGSATKRARFERWLARTENHPPPDALTCPIGAAGLGDKRAEVIAAFTAAEIMAGFAR